MTAPVVIPQGERVTIWRQAVNAAREILKPLGEGPRPTWNADYTGRSLMAAEVALEAIDGMLATADGQSTYLPHLDDYRQRVVDFNGDDEALLKMECEQYGLPVSLRALLMHAYGNRAFLIGIKDSHIRMLQQRLEHREAALRTIAQGWLPDGDEANIPTVMFAEKTLEARP